MKYPKNAAVSRPLFAYRAEGVLTFTTDDDSEYKILQTFFLISHLPV